jgi:hypothetical protein
VDEVVPVGIEMMDIVMDREYKEPEEVIKEEKEVEDDLTACDCLCL